MKLCFVVPQNLICFCLALSRACFLSCFLFLFFSFFLFALSPFIFSLRFKRCFISLCFFVHIVFFAVCVFTRSRQFNLEVSFIAFAVKFRNTESERLYLKNIFFSINLNQLIFDSIVPYSHLEFILALNLIHVGIPPIFSIKIIAQLAEDVKLSFCYVLLDVLL